VSYFEDLHELQTRPPHGVKALDFLLLDVGDNAAPVRVGDVDGDHHLVQQKDVAVGGLDVLAPPLHRVPFGLINRSQRNEEVT